MKIWPLIILLGLFLTMVRGDDLVTTDGKTYAAYTVVAHDASGISIWYRGGEATLPFDVLPANIQKDYGYKPKQVEVEWKTNYEDSLHQAKTEKKLLLLDFTGSDWCGYCQLLHKEVFTTPAFQAFAQANFVCVKLDFPHQLQLSPRLQKQNEAMQEMFGVTGFPTLIVVDTDNKELGRTSGYSPGSGPDAVISTLKPFIPTASASGN